MEIKYEAVFGPQELFDGLMTDCEFANEEYGYKFAKGRLYYCERYNERAGWRLSCKSHLTFKPSAMRQIIRTPTWTKEDQKAGKLPPVGCRVLYARNGLNGEIVSIDDSDDDDVELCLRFKDKSLLVCKMNLVKPIESPEEKAARLRDEWVEKAVGATPVYEIAAHGYSTRLKIDISSIYDAMISGDLPVPVKGE